MGKAWRYSSLISVAYLSKSQRHQEMYTIDKRYDGCDGDTSRTTRLFRPSSSSSPLAKKSVVKVYTRYTLNRCYCTICALVDFQEQEALHRSDS